MGLLVYSTRPLRILSLVYVSSGILYGPITDCLFTLRASSFILRVLYGLRVWSTGFVFSSTGPLWNMFLIYGFSYLLYGSFTGYVCSLRVLSFLLRVLYGLYFFPTGLATCPTGPLRVLLYYYESITGLKLFNTDLTIRSGYITGLLRDPF
jgi:hypothetical protein